MDFPPSQNEFSASLTTSGVKLKLDRASARSFVDLVTGAATVTSLDVRDVSGVGSAAETKALDNVAALSTLDDKGKGNACSEFTSC